MQRPGGIKQTPHLVKEGGGLVDLGKRWGEQARSALWEDRGAGGAVKVCSDVGGLPPLPAPRSRTLQAGLRGRKDLTDGTAAGSGEDYLF